MVPVSGIAAAHDARHQEVADHAGVGDRVLVLEARPVDALALCHLSSLLHFLTRALSSSPNTSNRSPLKRCSSSSSIGW
jgi:hypothetical protein